jgi:betaine-aldehyde dehydrogenase
MNDLKLMFIDGAWATGTGTATKDILDPATGTVIAKAVQGTLEDTERAIASARKAFDEGPWRETTALARARILLTLADVIDAHTEELAAIETANNGKPLRESRYDVADAANCFRYYAGLVTKPTGQTYEVPDNMQAMTVREPIGVCGQIVPWNYPLLMGAWKLAPALAAGNCVVFKPAEVTPLSIHRLFELMEPLGFPPGVINLVLGKGSVIGNRIAESMDVDKVAFTGGTDTGRSIMTAAAGNIKKLSLELGGKSPCIVFKDADLETAVDWALFAIFANQGQVCSAGSRLLVQKSIYPAFIERLGERAKKIVVGAGNVETTEMGPLVSQHQMETVLKYIEIGKADGARLLCGGKRLTDGEYSKGYFVEPTIFVDCTPKMRIVQEEIFGPVLAVLPFEDEAEAIRLANDSVFGLAGGVFTNDGARGLRVIKKLRAGITWINAYHPTYNEAPWGGYKQSGMGRELGTYGLDAYTEVKQININLAPGPVGWFAN